MFFYFERRQHLHTKRKRTGIRINHGHGLASSLELVSPLIINKKEREQIWNGIKSIYGFVDASGCCYCAGIDGRLMAAAATTTTHQFRYEHNLVQVERHADDDLDADSGKQVFVNASPVIL